MSTDPWVIALVFLVLPACFAIRFSLTRFIAGLLVTWMLFGVFIELSLVSCRPGWEPLRGVTHFCMGFFLFAPFWSAAFFIIYEAIRLLSGIRRPKNGTNDKK